MKKILTVIILFSLISISGAISQPMQYISIQYDMSFGTGDLGEYITKPSFRGISFQYRHGVNDNILVGLDVGWNLFYEAKDYDSYTVGTRTLTGKQWRYQHEVPILIAADYLITSGRKVNPYIGVGLGTISTVRYVEMGTWALKENPWHFALKPEVGFLAEMSSTTSFKLSAKYLIGFKSEDLESQSYFTVSAGLAFHF
jgi:outer membrane protein